MARRRRRSHRRYGSMVKIPGLGVLNKSVNTTDVLVGAAVGLGGTLLLKGFGNKMLAGTAPDWLLKGSPMVGGALAGGAMYFLGKKKNMAKANGHLFGDVVSLKLGRYGNRYGKYGVFVDEKTPSVGPGGYGGLVVNDPQRSLSDGNLAQLAQVSMSGGMGDGDMESLMELD